MKLFSAFTSSTSSSTPTTKMAITTEDIRNYKEILLKMKGQKMNATAMHIITNETIYRVTVEVATKAIAVLKKVIRRGQCQYKAGSKTDRLMTTFQKVLREYKEMVLKMEMKMVPTRADYLIECWLKKDAAEQAAKDYKDLRAAKKAAKRAAEEAASVTKETILEESYIKVPEPEPLPGVVINTIIEIIV